METLGLILQRIHIRNNFVSDDTIAMDKKHIIQELKEWKLFQEKRKKIHKHWKLKLQ